MSVCTDAPKLAVPFGTAPELQLDALFQTPSAGFAFQVASPSVEEADAAGCAVAVDFAFACGLVPGLDIGLGLDLDFVAICFFAVFMSFSFLLGLGVRWENLPSAG
jgi:hypothetical protein